MSNCIGGLHRVSFAFGLGRLHASLSSQSLARLAADRMRHVHVRHITFILFLFHTVYNRFDLLSKLLERHRFAIAHSHYAKNAAP